MKIQESAENYLEAILMLQDQRGYVRSVDIAGQLQVTKPSVSRAMSLLRENGYIIMEKNGRISLTDRGMEIAAHVYERHRILTAYLTGLGVNPRTAADDACRVEHVISQETFEKIKQLVS